ncbi:MAG TPA: DNA-processing protein DprA, partial [Myxococcales bacterium]
MNESSASFASAETGVLAACALHAVPGVGNASLHAMQRVFASLQKAFEAGPRELLERADDLNLHAATREYLAGSPDLEELGGWALAEARRADARILLLGDARYPQRLAQLDKPPLVLYVRGHLAAEARRVAIVGARHSDEEGLRIARRFGEQLSQASVQVVSGGARGVDSAAHEGASHGQQSVAVLGCGVDVVYPPENRSLFERMAKSGGAVVSEFPPGTQPRPGNFPRRNRTIAGLSEAVVVVRAALRSGAMITAEQAVVARRRVFAVPGQPGNPISAGPDELIRLGVADPVPTATRVLELLDWPVPDELRGEADKGLPGGPERTDLAARQSNALRAVGTVSEAGHKLLGLLHERAPSHVDDLAEKAGLSVSQTLRKLAELEQKGMCLS